MNQPIADQEVFRTILGVRFFIGTASEAVARGMRGGLVVAPAAPILTTLADDVATRDALLQSQLALSDSGLMVLVWNFLKRDHVPRISGLEYIKLMVDKPEFRAPGASFWIMPNEEALQKTLRWLEQRGDRVTRDACYLAPMYGKGAIDDPELLRLLEARRPPHIVVGIGGGVQERLGAYLQAKTSFWPAIHCIGAAIGFLSGAQVHIPMWADRWRVGWLIRCLSAPRIFIPRYWNARKLVGLILEYGERLPASRSSQA